MLETILHNRFAVTAVLLFGIGFMNLLLQQNLLKKVVGFNIMDSAVFMLLASLGYIEGRVAPVMGEGVTPDASLFINPIPSGLVLTGIVVSVSITAFSLALIQRIHKHYGTIEMKELLARCMREGAKGLSLGLIYPPGSYGKTDEIIELAKVVAQYDGIIMVHMRNEKDLLLESIDEMVRVIQESGVRLQISHHKALGKPNWGKVHQSIAKINDLRALGYDLTIDQYPWEAASTGLKVCAPGWAFAGGEQAFLDRLRDPETYRKILAETREEIEVRGGAHAILIASVATEEYTWMEGKRMDEICEKLGMEVGEAVLSILQHEGTSVVATYFSISEDDVRFVMQAPYHCVCTDGIVGGKPHPRAYASFPRFLGTYVRDKKVMALEEAIRHITSEPARRLRLWDRGLIREGMDADLVLFDPETIKDVNSYMQPDLPPVGIRKVWVLGEEKYSG